MTDVERLRGGGTDITGASAIADGRARPSAPPPPAVSSAATVSGVALAWIAVLPTALVTVAAIVLLGPPLGHVLFSPGSQALWPPGWWGTTAHPEPAKHGRYLLAALAPLLLAAFVLVGTRRGLRLRPQIVRAITFTTQVMLAACMVVAVLKHNWQFGAAPLVRLGTAVTAAALVLVAMIVLRDRAVRARIAGLARETRARRAAGIVVAGSFVAIWLLKVLMTDRLSSDFVGLNLPYAMNEAMALLNGLTPLVNYHTFYSTLIPYPTSLVLEAFGSTIFVYTTWMAVLSAFALLAVYAVFRLIARSSLAALALFVPFLATSDLGTVSTPAAAVSPMTLSAMWPMRYGGAYLMAWLTARHIAERRPRGMWIVFFVGGLVAINNLEFGVSALVASVAALLCARPPRSSGAVLRLTANVAGGALGAIAAVCLLTLVRAGTLPNFALLMEWPRLFTKLGWFSQTLPTVGFHLVLYATFAAAVIAAAVRLSRSAGDVLLTGMLAWSGIFGLFAGAYFIGRPDTYKLYSMFSAWSFALVMLTILSVRGLAASGWRRPTVPQVLVLFGFGLSICSISEISSPINQIDRLTKPLPEPTYEASVRQFVRKHTHAGEPVVILVPMGHRIAYDLGLRNVAPYAFMNVIVTRSQLQKLIDTARKEDVREIFTPAPDAELRQEGVVAPEQLEMLDSEGFKRASSEAGILELKGS